MPPLLGVGTVAHPQQRFLQSSLEWLCDSRRKPGCGLWGICVARGIRACVAPWREAGSSRAAPGSALPVSPAAARLRRPQDAAARHGARLDAPHRHPDPAAPRGSGRICLQRRRHRSCPDLSPLRRRHPLCERRAADGGRRLPPSQRHRSLTNQAAGILNAPVGFSIYAVTNVGAITIPNAGPITANAGGIWATPLKLPKR
jgi:hypothetical protein